MALEAQTGECIVCKAPFSEWRLTACGSCRRMVCEGCAHRAYGRVFCSRACSHIFFFGDDEDDN